jgi:hypothetical protein
MWEGQLFDFLLFEAGSKLTSLHLEQYKPLLFLTSSVFLDDCERVLLQTSSHVH